MALLVVLAAFAVALVIRVVVAIVRDRHDDPLSAEWRDEHAGRRDDDVA